MDLAALYQEHRAMVYRTAYHVLQDARDAEDTVQDTFVRVMKYGIGDRHWIARVAKTTAIDLYRKKQAHATADCPDDLVVDTVIQVEEAEEIERVLGQLDEDEQRILVCRYWHGMRVEAIAKELGLTAACVKSRLFRALQRARWILEAHMELPERAKRIADLVWQPNVAKRKIEQWVTDALKGQDVASRSDERRVLRKVVENTKANSPWGGIGYDSILKEIDEREKSSQ